MIFILVFYLIGSTFSLHRFGYVSECTEPGLKCASCEKLIFCLGTGPETMQQIDLKTCDNTSGQYCSVAEGGCSKDPRVCDIFGVSIDCQDAGLFPDPFDCTSYHECVSDSSNTSTGYKDYRRSCKTGLAYDPLSTICRLKKTDRVCKESPVPKCLKSLQMGALIENPTLYYICIGTSAGIYPRLYRCPYGLLFDANTSQCVETLTPTSTLKPKVEFHCPSPGVFADPYDCRRYYLCSTELVALHKTCRPGSYFEPNFKLCTVGLC